MGKRREKRGKKGKKGKKAPTDSWRHYHRIPLHENYVKMFVTLRCSATKRKEGRKKKEERGKDPALGAVSKQAVVTSL